MQRNLDDILSKFYSEEEWNKDSFYAFMQLTQSYPIHWISEVVKAISEHSNEDNYYEGAWRAALDGLNNGLGYVDDLDLDGYERDIFVQEAIIENVYDFLNSLDD